MPERLGRTRLQPVMAVLPALLLLGTLWLHPTLGGDLVDGDGWAGLPFDAARLALLALAVTLALAGGGWDLATGAYAMTASCKVMALQTLLALPAAPAAAAGLLASAALGACTGGLATALRRPAWLTSGIVLLVALAAIAGLAATGLPADGSRLAPALLALPDLPPLPTALAVALGAMVALPLLIHRTVLGNRLLALRADPHLARALGVPVAATRITLHAAVGLLAGLAGVLAMSAPATDGVAAAITDSLLAVAAAVLGGALGARFAAACVGAVVVAVTLVALRLVLPSWLLAGTVGLLVVVQLWLARPGPASAGELP